MTAIQGGVAGPPDAGPTSAADTLMLTGALLLALLLLAGGFWRWPWDHDEVLSLAELGVIPYDHYVGPLAQMEKVRLVLPVWYHTQRAALAVLPPNEFGARVMPVGAALVLVVFSTLWACRRSVRFGTALALVAGCSPMLVWLAQQNRFYSLALCLMAAALFAASSRRSGWGVDLVAAALTVGSVLSHGLTLVVFCIACAAAACAHWWVLPRPVLVRRTAICAAAATLVYGLYIRPLLAGWVSGGTGGTPPLVSYLAQFGLSPFGLVLFGAAVILVEDRDTEMVWWLFLAAGSLVAIAGALIALKSWNPRYALFFMWPAWIVAARAVQYVADRLRPKGLRVVWYTVVFLLMAPKLLSHLADGTRHDFRSAARIIAAQPPADVVSNWPATLQYYLERERPGRVRDWQPGSPLPPDPLVLVFASNAWESVLRLPDRDVSVLAEVKTRRFDEQSHVIRIYSLGARRSQELPAQ